MSYVGLLESRVPNQTGNQAGNWWNWWARPGDVAEVTHQWNGWQAAVHSPWFMRITGTSTTSFVLVFDTLPILNTGTGTSRTRVKKMLDTIEAVFGDSASDLARILNVSRPMIYHWRQGMEPELDNRRRLQTIAEVATEFQWLLNEPLLLKERQPEGRTLLDYLSEKELDIPVVRRVVQRNIDTADQELRSKFAKTMMTGQTPDARRDITRERHKEGKPVYIGDPQSPGRLIQILPNGRRVRGRMVKRRFTPDE